MNIDKVKKRKEKKGKERKEKKDKYFFVKTGLWLTLIPRINVVLIFECFLRIANESDGMTKW